MYLERAHPAFLTTLVVLVLNPFYCTKLNDIKNVFWTSVSLIDSCQLLNYCWKNWMKWMRWLILIKMIFSEILKNQKIFVLFVQYVTNNRQQFLLNWSLKPWKGVTMGKKTGEGHYCSAWFWSWQIWFCWILRTILFNTERRKDVSDRMFYFDWIIFLKKIFLGRIFQRFN